MSLRMETAQARDGVVIHRNGYVVYCDSRLILMPYPFHRVQGDGSYIGSHSILPEC